MWFVNKRCAEGWASHSSPGGRMSVCSTAAWHSKDFTVGWGSCVMLMHRSFQFRCGCCAATSGHAVSWVLVPMLLLACDLLLTSIYGRCWTDLEIASGL